MEIRIYPRRQSTENGNYVDKYTDPLNLCKREWTVGKRMAGIRGGGCFSLFRSEPGGTTIQPMRQNLASSSAHRFLHPHRFITRPCRVYCKSLCSPSTSPHLRWPGSDKCPHFPPGLPAFNPSLSNSCPHCIQNGFARRSLDHVTPLLKTLQWLPKETESLV